MFSPRRFLFAALTLGLSACQVEVAGIEPIDIVGRPGLEPWYAKLIKPAPEEKPAAAPPPVPAAEPAPEPEIGAMGPYLRPPVFPALKMPPTVGMRAAKRSTTSVDGVMG